jgi:hypothetical protein
MHLEPAVPAGLLDLQNRPAEDGGLQGVWDGERTRRDGGLQKTL